jgi:phosphinothricin acetyltransferase
MNIRLANKNDLRSINEIYNMAIPTGISTADTEPVTLKERKRWFRKHRPEKYPIFVAERNREVVGWISLGPYRPGRKALRFTAEVSYYIHPDYQNQGIGSKLMSLIIEKAPLYNIKTLIALLLEQNKASITLLKKFSFEQWGLMPRAADFNGREDGHLYYGLRIN